MTPDGWHLPILMPQGLTATGSCYPAKGIEVRGPGAYVVSPASRLKDGTRYLPEPDRDVWWLPNLPSDWPFLPSITGDRHRGAGIITGDLPVTRGDRREASRVIEGVLAGPNAGAIRDILARARTTPQGSRSEADFRLLRMVLPFARDAQVLAAILEHGPVHVQRARRDLARYTAVTVGAALSGEHGPGASASEASFRALVAERVAAIRAGLTLGPNSGERTPYSAYNWEECAYGTPPPSGDITHVVLAFVEWTTHGDPWACEGQWVQLPCGDLARALKCDRRSITRALDRLEDRHLIERQIRRRHEPPYRTQSFARILGARE
jgi:hypothetical protein